MGAAPTVRFADVPPATADLAIIGGGVVGCATAFFAARAGLNVVVLERRAALATLTTPVSTGAFRLQFDNAEEIELVREGIELFESFADRTGLDGWDLGLRHGGYLFCSLTDATVERSRRLIDRQREWGLTDVELLTRRRGPRSLAVALARRPRRAVPGRRRLAGPEAAERSATPRPRRTPAAIPDAAPGGGATFVTHAGAHEIVVDGDRVRGVRTTRGEVAADAVVIATGPFLGPDRGARRDRRSSCARRGARSSSCRRLPQVPADAPMTIEEETAAHWRPVVDGAIALFTDPGTPPSEPHDPVPIEHDWAFGLLDPTLGPRAREGRARSGATSGPMARRRRTGSSRPGSTR